MFIDDAKVGNIADEFIKFMDKKNHTKVEVLSFFNECFMAKDSEEIENMRRSSKITAYFFSKFIKEVEVVIDSGKPTKHSELAQKVIDLLESESELKKCAIKLTSSKIVKDYIDYCIPCTVQSGGVYSSKMFIESNDKELKSDCITLGMGAMYRSYITFIGRTLLIDPTEMQKSIYKKAETLFKVIIQNLRVGVKICDVYKKARQFMGDNLSSVEIPKNFGNGMGILLNENPLAINESNDRTIQIGNSFLVTINFPEIK
jgi:nucleosome binding factor SPN SPT16 subunit